MKKFLLLSLICLAVVGMTTAPSDALAKKFKAKVGGGPTGGTFNTFANAMAVYLPKNMTDIKVMAVGSQGSVENVKRISAGDNNFGLCHGVDSALGREGLFSQDKKKYDSVRVLGFLYGAPVQLVVRADSDINSAADLVGKKVGIGEVGSGAAASAERFLSQLGIWADIDSRHLGYSAAATAFKKGEIDAFWVLAGYPNRSVTLAGVPFDIRLVDLDKDAKASGFYDKYDYLPVVIPAGTYGEKVGNCATFQDATFLCANAEVPAETVYEIMRTLWSKSGLAAMAAAKSTFGTMSVESGLTGVNIPLHEGAIRFWEKKGLAVPAELK